MASKMCIFQFHIRFCLVYPLPVTSSIPHTTVEVKKPCLLFDRPNYSETHNPGVRVRVDPGGNPLLAAWSVPGGRHKGGNPNSRVHSSCEL
eukprot:scaffold250636_cov28-Tisochrysis_lutea.AAC.1